MPQQFIHRTHSLNLDQLIVIVLQGKAVFLQLLCQFLGLLHVKLLLCFFNQRQHIAHTQDSRGHPVWVEHLDIIQLFPHAHKLNGLAGHRLNGQGGAATGIAV